MNTESKPRENKTHTVFGAEGCRYQLRKDLDGAHGRVILVSPYVTVNAISEWREPVERAVTRGVVVCALIREPRHWQWYLKKRTDPEVTARMQHFAAALELIRAIGGHLILRKEMHEKLIIIDEDILWEGSKNVLSWFETSERTRRFKDKSEVDDAFEEHNLRECKRCNEPPTIANQLSTQRVRRGLTTLELAAKIKTTRKTIWEFETGRTEPNVKRVNQICDELDVDLIAVPRYLSKRVRNIVALSSQKGASHNSTNVESS